MFRNLLGVMSLPLLVIGCGGAKGSVDLSFLSTNLAVNNLEQFDNKTSSFLPFVTAYSDLGLAATSTGNGLQSFKMYPREIKICQSLTENGSGYTDVSGCVTVYSNDSDTYTGLDYPTADHRATFAAAGEGKYYDILSATDRALLNSTQEFDVGDYNYGIIEMHPWVKIKAKSGSICTKAAGAAENYSSGGDGYRNYYTEVTSMNCGSGEAEEVLVYITNANTNFKFAQPFSVAEGGSYSLDLAFNMDGAVKVIDDAVGGNLRDGTDSLYIPMIRMMPSPRAAAGTTKVETYTFVPSTTGSTGNFKIRAEVYYDSTDTTKAPLAVLATVLAGTDTTKDISNKAVSISSVTAEGNTITTKSWNGSTGLVFTRTDSGTAASATLVCGAHGTTGAAFVAASDPADAANDLCVVGTINLSDSNGPTTVDLGATN
jgi:hypothetical protein